MIMPVGRAQEITAASINDLRPRRVPGIAKVAGTVFVGLAVYVFSAAPAFAVSAWWQLSSSAAPTNLVPGSGVDEVQEIAVSATGGAFALEGRFDGEETETRIAPLKTTPLAWNASRQQMQAALEEVYEAGNVQVSGGPEGGVLKPYTVTFVEALADRRVPRILPLPEGLAGGEERVTTFERVKGRPAGKITLVASNIGDAPREMEKGPVRIVDRLPPGLTATAARGEAGPGFEQQPELEPFLEEGLLTVCHVLQPREVECTYNGRLPSFQGVRVEIAVNVGSVPTDAVNEATVTAPGTPTAFVSQPVKASGAPTPFGVEGYELRPEDEGGTLDIQAASHPFQTTFTISMNKGLAPGPEEDSRREQKEEEQLGVETVAASAKDVNVNLPQGLIGDPTAVPQCSDARFAQRENFKSLCPSDTAVGVAIVTISHAQEGGLEGVHTIPVPLFNLVPGHGEPARLGFTALEASIVIDTALRSGHDYAVISKVSDISELADVLSTKVVIWGAPGDPRHHEARGNVCLHGNEACAGEPNGLEPKAFFTLPTSCEGELQSSVEAVSWEEAAEGKGLQSFSPTVPLQTLTGCENVPFKASVSVALSASSANVPVGASVHVHVPQQASSNPNGLAEANVRKTTVALPAGLQINPAAAGGLQACSERDIGFERLEANGQPVFSEESDQERQGEAPHQECPEASKLGKVSITTPLLPEPLTGWVYQASQDGGNPFGSLLALYVVAEDKQAGVRVRLAGEVKVEGNGRLVSTFDQTPQTPFEEFTLETFGDSKAPLATTGCGTYKTEGAIEPWTGTPAISLLSEFAVNGSCASPEPFAPTFEAGTVNNQAGGYSPFTLTLTRNDSEQTLSTVSTTLPPGLLGKIAGIPRCGEAEANAGTCPAASQIGHVRVSSGVGPEPVSLPEAGRREDPVYLTGPYGGGPFGLSIVVHPEAGPFNLEENGHPVVVRARISVNPATSQISVVSEPMPVRLQGIPVDVRNVQVVIERPGGQPFEFNPTSCKPTSIGATIGSSEGGSENVASPFQAANCANLPFKPTFSAATIGHASKAEGTSLTVKVGSKGGPQPGGGEANIRAVKVDLPKQLPSRLTTLNRACLAKVFEANPENCPKESAVGTAVASTPVLNVPLTGPAYIVSYGNEKFPNLEIVLQGEGVKIVLEGNTQIKKGITSSTFKTVPDAPVTSFELKLHTGKFSILGANVPQKDDYNMCGQTLNMPTAITGQNGAVVKQTTKIGITGCGKAAALTRAQKLAKALKACRKKKGAKRASCEAKARRMYGPLKKKKGRQ